MRVNVALLSVLATVSAGTYRRRAKNEPILNIVIKANQQDYAMLGSTDVLLELMKAVY